MFIKINKKVLINGLDIVKKAISNNPSSPALSGIVISVDVDHLDIIASNGFFSIKHEIKKKENILSINKIGRILFKTRYLVELIKKIDDDIITIEAFDESVVRIICDKSTFELKPLQYSSYPIINFKKLKGIKLSTNKIIDMCNFVKKASSENLQRIILTGVFLKLEKNKLRAIATNSYRLANYEVDVDVNDEFEVIIPANFLKELSSIIKQDNDIIIWKSNGRVVVNYKNNLLQINEIEGNYPNIDKLLPKQFNNKIIVNKNKLLSIIDRSIVLSDGDDKAVTLNIKNNTIEISNASQNIGAGKEIIQCEEFSGENIKVTFKAKYIVNSLRVFNGENVIINIHSHLKPVIIHETSGNKNFQLILPYKV